MSLIIIVSYNIVIVILEEKVRLGCSTRLQLASDPLDRRRKQGAVTGQNRGARLNRCVRGARGAAASDPTVPPVPTVDLMWKEPGPGECTPKFFFAIMAEEPSSGDARALAASLRGDPPGNRPVSRLPNEYVGALPPVASSRDTLTLDHGTEVLHRDCVPNELRATL